jgi:hypothetical protein
MLPGRFARGHLKRGEATDAFAGAVADVIEKGVAYYTNLTAGSGPPSGKLKKSARSYLLYLLTFYILA